MKLSNYQQAIINFVADEDSDEHGIGSAYAGSGKTFLLQRCAEAVDDEVSMFFGAFNTPIANELSKKIQRANTEISTLHSLAYRTLRKHWRKENPKIPDGVDYLRVVVDDVLPKKIDPDVAGDIHTLVEKAMAFVADDDADKAHDRVTELMYRFQCSPADERITPPDQYVEWALNVLARLREPSSTICFGQMIYVPAYHRWPTGHFRRVFIDETQDMNRAQLIAAKSALHEHGRFFAVGDRKQAIYAWNGADTASMDKIKRTFKAREFKLPISYRAPESVAELVREYIPDFQARSDAPRGLVKTVTTAFMREHWRPGDFFLSRKNAPLPKACLMALRDGVPAYIKGGKDMTKGLFALIAKSRKHDIGEFLGWLKDYGEKRHAVLVAAKQERNAEELLDTTAALVELSDGCDTTHELRQRLNKLFVDENPDGKLMVSSVHRAKGLETEDGRAVWLDAKSFRTTSDEERNIAYVAQTRTRDKLYFVKDQ